MEIIFALIVGAVVGWFVGRQRGVLAERRRHQADLARAWQEGYEAGSFTSAQHTAVPLTSPVVTADDFVSPSGAPVAGEYRPGRTPPPPSTTPSNAAPLTAPELISQPPSVPVSPPPPTPEERAEQKKRRDLRNVNITLYAACLLLVSAAALFIGTAFPASARMVGLAGVTVLFYLGGLVIHAVSPRLRPAATAFTGTGLALVPITGLALDALILDRPALAWLITSAVGTVMMVIAAARLNSRVVAYLAVPFLLSTVIAAGAQVQQGMIWGLTASIALATVMAWFTATDDGRPHVPEPFDRAMAEVHHWITPGIVVLAVVLGQSLDPIHYVVLLVAASAYYVTVAVTGRPGPRLYASYAARVTVSAAVGTFLWMVDAGHQAIFGSLAIVLAVQVLVVAWEIRRSRTGVSPLRERGFLPRGSGIRLDQATCLALMWFLAQAAQLELPAQSRPPVSLAWALLVAVTIVLVVDGVRVSRFKDGQRFVWQLLVPLVLVPGSWVPWVETPWRLITVVGVAAAAQIVVALLLWRRADIRSDLDVRIAPDLAALWVVVLGGLLAAEWAGPARSIWPGMTVAALALAWASVRVLRPGAPEAIGDALTGTLFGAIGLGGLISASATSESGESSPVVQAGLLTLMVVIGGLALWWPRGRPAAPRTATSATDPALPVPTRAMLEPSAAATWPLAIVLISALVLLVGAAWTLEVDAGDWMGLVALAVVAMWFTALALVTGTRLAPVLRITAMLAGQATLALVVARAVDLLGADNAAVRAAAAITLTLGMGLRYVLRHRSHALAVGPIPTAVIGGAVSLLWIVESVATQDRAALIVIGLCLAGVGSVLGLRGRGHGRWLLLASAVSVALSISDAMPLRHGGWLPEPLVPAAVAAALLLLGQLGLTLREARRAPATADLFRPAAMAVVWVVALIAALTPETAHAVLAVGAGTAALSLYVLARTRDLTLLTIGTVLAVAAASMLALQAGDEAGWAPRTTWWPGIVGIVSLTVLWTWSILDERLQRQTGWGRAALLRHGGALVLATGGVVSLGEASDAVVLLGCALTTLAAWLPVQWWRSTRAPVPAGWWRHALDAAALITVLMGIRAWWTIMDVESTTEAIWWSVQVVVLALFGVAAGHLRDHDDEATGRRRALWWAVAAAAVMSLSAVMVVVEGSDMMQLLSLIGFAGLLLLGLISRTSLFTWWGAAGVTAAVLWFLRGYTVLWLTLLGVILIALAVRQLMRSGRQEERIGSDR